MLLDYSALAVYTQELSSVEYHVEITNAEGGEIDILSLLLQVLLPSSILPVAPENIDTVVIFTTTPDLDLTLFVCLFVRLFLCSKQLKGVSFPSKDTNERPMLSI